MCDASFIGSCYFISNFVLFVLNNVSIHIIIIKSIKGLLLQYIKSIFIYTDLYSKALTRSKFFFSHYYYITLIILLLCFDLLTRPKMPFKAMHRKEVIHSNGSHERKSRGRKLADEMGRGKKKSRLCSHRLTHWKRVTSELHDS